MPDSTFLENSEFAPLDGEDIAAFNIENDDGVRSDLPHVIFLIPGIRTDGDWAQILRLDAHTFAGRPILCKPVRGNGGNIDRLNSLHVLTRVGLQSFRNSFRSQINHVLKKNPAYTVNIVAHSMGSSVFSEIVQDVNDDIEALGYKLNKVVFLGSVCHRKHSSRISDCCETFINDVGRRDLVPYLASIANPWCYGDVGTRGFLDAYVSFDRFFNHNHSSCTSISHLKEHVLPLIETSQLTEEGSYPRPFKKALVSSNIYAISKWAFWVLGPLLVLLILYAAIIYIPS